MNRVSLRKSLSKQGFSATMSGFWGPEGDWGIRRVAYVGGKTRADVGICRSCVATVFGHFLATAPCTYRSSATDCEQYQSRTKPQSYPWGTRRTSMHHQTLFKF